MKKLKAGRHTVATLVLSALMLITLDVKGQRDNALNASLNQIQLLYSAEQFEAAYDSLQYLYNTNTIALDKEKEAIVLDWGIRLSFLSEDWTNLDQYISAYYALDPFFSASQLSESSPQLREYIENYVRVKSEKYVYVNKNRQNIDFIPATVTVYDKEDIERLGARNLLDLIRLTPGFAELGDNNERMMGTRGSSATTLQDVLFLINGHRITDILTDSNAPDWISLDYVEQIELVRGPGSALYGGSAFNGVVNVITKNGRFQEMNELNIRLGTGNDFRSLAPEFNTYHLNYQIGKRMSNTEGIYLSATYIQSGGSEIDYAESDEKPILGTRFRAPDLTGREYINRYGPGYNLLFSYSNNSLLVTANSQLSQFIYARPDSLNLWNNLDRDSLRQQRRRVDGRNFVQIEYDFLDNSARSHNRLQLKISGDHFHKDFTTNRYSVGIEENTQLVGDEYRATASIEYASDSLFSKSGKHKNHFLVGAEAFINHWRYLYYRQADTTLQLSKIGDQFTEPGDQRNEYIGAVYLQNEYHLINDRFIGTVGVRINYHNLYSNFGEFKWGEQYSPRFALIYLPRKNKNGLNTYKFKLLYNSAFLPPPFLYRREGDVRGFEGNPELDPQSIESGEAVIYGDINKNISYSALTYINKIHESIVRADTGEFTFINRDNDERVSGIELEIKYRHESKSFDWYSFANVSITRRLDFNNSDRQSYFNVFDSDLTSEESTLKGFPGSNVNMGFDASFKTKSFSTVSDLGVTLKKIRLGATAQWIGKTRIESQLFINDQGILENSGAGKVQNLPAAFLTNLHLKAYISKFNLGLSAYNLFDKDYYLPSVISLMQRQRGEGRMILLSFKYNFN